LQHGVSGVTQQRNPAVGPVHDGFAVAEHPHLPHLDSGQKLLDLRACSRETFTQFRSISEGVPTLVVLVAVEHGHKIEQLTAAQRIMHEMRFLAAPQAHFVAPEMRWHVFSFEHRAVGDMA
jgi:hypothetical protein